MRLLLLCLCAAYYLFANVWQQIPGLSAPSDFTHYHRAAQLVLMGRSPYAGPDFNYPPLIAFLLAPLGLLSYLQARWVWFAMSHLFLLCAAILVWRHLGRKPNATLCIAFVWAFGGAAGENLGLGQAGPLLVLLLALAYTRPGLAIGAGFALKFIPGVLGVALVLNRNWRALAKAGLVAVLLLVLPWFAVAYGLKGSSVPGRVDYWSGTPALLNWSLPAIVLRVLDPPERGPTLPPNWLFGNYLPNLHLAKSHRMAALAASAVTLVLGIIALAVSVRGILTRSQLPLAMAALLSLSLAASPVCWTHYQIMQYPGIALLLFDSVELRQWGMAAWTMVLGALLYPLPVSILSSYFQKYGRWTAESPITLFTWTSVTPIACVAVFALCLYRLRACSPQSEPLGESPCSPGQ